MNLLPVFNSPVKEMLPNRQKGQADVAAMDDFGRHLDRANVQEPSTRNKNNISRDTEDLKNNRNQGPHEDVSDNTARDVSNPDRDTVSDTDPAEYDAPSGVIEEGSQTADLNEIDGTASGIVEEINEAHPVLTDVNIVEVVVPSLTGEAAHAELNQAVVNPGNNQSESNSMRQVAQNALVDSPLGGLQPVSENGTATGAAVAVGQQAFATETDRTAPQGKGGQTTGASVQVVHEVKPGKYTNVSSTSDEGQSQDQARQQSSHQLIAHTATQAGRQAASASAISMEPMNPASAVMNASPVSGEGHASSSLQTAHQAMTSDGESSQLNTARIARGLQNAVSQKGGAVTLRLTPPEMGTVRIQLQIQNGTVNAQFHAETESARSLLHQQISHLRTALEQHGLNVERLGVHTMHSASGSSLHQQSQGDTDTRSDDGRSRGSFTQQHQGRGRESGDRQQREFREAMNDAA